MTAPQLHGGAVGTELSRRGFGLTAPRWSAAANLEAPELVASIHRDYAQAGAALVTANTTCVHEHIVGDDLARHCAIAIDLARRANVAVAASLSMLPASIDADERTARYQRAAAAMAGADVLLLEGFVDPDELLRAVAATATWQGPRWAALAGPGVHHLPRLAATVVGVDLLAAHCCPLRDAEAALAATRAAHAERALGCYPSPARDDDPHEFAHALVSCARAHRLRWVGSCCGSTPATTAAIAQALSASDRRG